MNDNLSKFIDNEILTRHNHLDDALTYNNKKFNRRSDFNYISDFIDNFIEGDEINRYIVLPGLRDTGKTTILLQIYEYLFRERNFKSSNIVYLSGEKLKNIFDASIMDAVKTYLSNYHNTDLMNLDEKIFLLVDEAQYDKNWSMTGKIIFDSSKKIFMIFTGSSALEFEYNADSARRMLKIPISPLNYSQHLNLKYGFSTYGISESLLDLIFDGKTEKAMDLERKIFINYPNIPNYDLKEWEEYLYYGGFPSSFFQSNRISSRKLIDIIYRVINTDMKDFGDFTSKTQYYANRLLYFLALQKPGDISQNSMANYLGCPASTVGKILGALEKTHLIFHLEPYSLSPKRGTKSFKYYYGTPSLRHSLALDLGIASTDSNAYKGILLENLVASSFFNLKNERKVMFNAYFDSKNKKKEKNVDFIVQRGFDKVIPIEVGIGKKGKSQIKNAIRRYKSDYGILISNATERIEKEDNIIKLPIKTFSLL